MARILQPATRYVHSLDVLDYGWPDTKIGDFLSPDVVFPKYDWVIANPPYRHAEAFIQRAWGISEVGCAFFLRLMFLESAGRYRRLFRPRPPTSIHVFTERVPIQRGRLDRKAGSMLPYAWFIWRHGSGVAPSPRLCWIPPCRSALELEGDYK